MSLADGREGDRTPIDVLERSEPNYAERNIALPLSRHRLHLGLLAVAASAALAAGCSKSESTSSAQASPSASSMVYSGATDRSTGGSAAATPASGADSGAVAMKGDAAHGKQIFTQNCSACHGASGVEGGVGPSLKGEKSKKDTAAAIAWIKNPSPPMPKLYPSPLDEKDVADVAAYVESL